jgi:hypothetical protein
MGIYLGKSFQTKVRGGRWVNLFGASTHWVFAALITLIYTRLLDKDKGIFKR